MTDNDGADAVVAAVLVVVVVEMEVEAESILGVRGVVLAIAAAVVRVVGVVSSRIRYNV